MDYSVRIGSQDGSTRIPAYPGAMARKAIDEQCSHAAASPFKAYDLGLTAASQEYGKLSRMYHAASPVLWPWHTNVVVSFV